MAQVRALVRSFAGGEVTPELFGRVDLSKMQTALQEAINFETRPHGPAENRPGFEYIQCAGVSASAVRIIPFTYNTEQSYIIELGDMYIRFHTAGATLLSGSALTVTGVSAANPGVLTYTGTDPSNGDWMYLASLGGITALNGRYVIVANVNAGANTFELTDLFGSNIDTSSMPAYTSGGTATPVYEITSPYAAADLFGIEFTQSADVMTLTHPSYAPRELSRVSATSWTLTSITTVPTIATPTGLSVTVGAGPGSGTTYDYVVTALASDGLEESLQSTNDTIVNDLNASGAQNNLAWTAVTGAVRYNAYRKDDGIYGYIGQTATNSFVDNNITPDLSITPPNTNEPFSSTDNYPAAVTYAEQRRVFAGTNTLPQTTWMTRAGTESNLSYSVPTRDDDSIVFRIAARENNTIRHCVPLGDLILLTANAAWRVSAGNQQALTPTTITAKPQAYVGSNTVQPVVTPASVLYVQAQGSRVQELVYVTDGNGSNGYQVNDASIMATHLFPASKQMVDMTYTHAPDKICWIVRSDGVLLGMTYEPRHEVQGWHQHTTDGDFESCAAIPENNADSLYVVVKRTVNGQTLRYIERKHTREFTTLSDCFFVDSGLSYSGAATDTISGLHHLEGETVALLADGATHPTRVVTDGTITLDHEYSSVHIGLPIAARIQLVPAIIQVQGYGQGQFKNVNEMFVRVYRSSPSMLMGADLSRLVSPKTRGTEAYGSPPALRTELLNIKTLPDYSDDAAMYIVQNDPLPLTVNSIAMEIEIGG